MSPFVSGVLGALAALVAVALLRRAFWALHLHRRHRRFPLRFLYRRLGTRPEQEQVISAEADTLAGELRALRADARSVREELADLLQAPAVDAGAVQAAIDARLSKLTALRERVAQTISRVHATLDPDQRATLSELIRRGGHRRHRCAHGRA